MAYVGRSIETSQSASSDSSLITNRPEGLSVSIQPGGFRGGGLFFTIWLCGWLFAEVFMGRMVLRLRGHVDLFHFPLDPAAFPAVWLALWSIAGYYAISRWLFAFWGRQELIIGAASISLRARVFGQARTEQFDIKKVENVRMVVDAVHARQATAISQVSSFRDQLAGSGLPDTTRAELERALEPRLDGIDQAARQSIWSIAFDVGGKTYGFGQGLSPTTCRMIQDAIERSRGLTAKAGA